MIAILKAAAKAAHTATLAQRNDSRVYSQYPVHESEFWEAVFKFARNPKTAKAVLIEINTIEDEPCIDNERVFRNVRQARSLAGIALMN